jgi:hypothetical protein
VIQTLVARSSGSVRIVTVAGVVTVARRQRGQRNLRDLGGVGQLQFLTVRENLVRNGNRQCRVEWSLDRVARGHRQIGFAEQYFPDCGREAQVNVYVLQAHARNDTEIALNRHPENT